MLTYTEICPHGQVPEAEPEQTEEEGQEDDRIREEVQREGSRAAEEENRSWREVMTHISMPIIAIFFQHKKCKDLVGRFET